MAYHCVGDCKDMYVTRIHPKSLYQVIDTHIYFDCKKVERKKRKKGKGKREKRKGKKEKTRKFNHM